MSNLSPINLMTGGLAHVVFSSWTVVFWEGKPRHVCDDILHNRLWVQQQQACIGASYQKEHTSRMACPKACKCRQSAHSRDGAAHVDGSSAFPNASLMPDALICSSCVCRWPVLSPPAVHAAACQLVQDKHDRRHHECPVQYQQPLR